MRTDATAAATRRRPGHVLPRAAACRDEETGQGQHEQQRRTHEVDADEHGDAPRRDPRHHGERPQDEEQGQGRPLRGQVDVLVLVAERHKGEYQHWRVHHVGQNLRHAFIGHFGVHEVDVLSFCIGFARRHRRGRFHIHALHTTGTATVGVGAGVALAQPAMVSAIPPARRSAGRSWGIIQVHDTFSLLEMELSCPQGESGVTAIIVARNEGAA